jgi:hypothetical protein
MYEVNNRRFKSAKFKLDLFWPWYKFPFRVFSIILCIKVLQFGFLKFCMAVKEMLIYYVIITAYKAFTSRFLVAASNAMIFSSLGDQNFAQSKLPSSHFSQLLVLIRWPLHGLHGKCLFHYFIFSCCWRNVSTELLCTNGCCTVACLHSSYWWWVYMSQHCNLKE